MCARKSGQFLGRAKSIVVPRTEAAQAVKPKRHDQDYQQRDLIEVEILQSIHHAVIELAVAHGPRALPTYFPLLRSAASAIRHADRASATNALLRQS
jgi:hypothetical protein